MFLAATEEAMKTLVASPPPPEQRGTNNDPLAWAHNTVSTAAVFDFVAGLVLAVAALLARITGHWNGYNQ